MVAELIAANQPCVALTGAGISTESGVPDFRSASGVWAEYDPYEVASIDGFRLDPARAWEFYGRRLGVLADIQPNAGHLALAALERAGLLEAVITQNVDGLHQRAGSTRRGRGARLDRHRELRRVRPCRAPRAGRRARCRSRPASISAALVLKPDVVMFGELLPAAAVDAQRPRSRARRPPCWSSARRSRSGRSPALPGETLGHGGRLAIVNREPTPYDAQADVVVHAGAGEVLAAAAAALSS